MQRRYAPPQRSQSGKSALALRNARAAIDRFAGQWHATSLGRRIEPVIEPRLRSSLGRCAVRRLLIKLNPIVLHRPRLLRETVGHELAHLIVYARHGPKCKPHGPEWRKLMQSAGLPIRTCVQMTGAIVDKGTKLSCLARRHTYRCPVCQARWVTRRTMKSWLCPFCLEAGLSGELLVE